MLKYIGDFEKLKEFGFEENWAGNYEKIFPQQCNDYIFINGYNREIMGGFGNTKFKYETLFDLIQANLVEKVGE